MKIIGLILFVCLGCLALMFGLNADINVYAFTPITYTMTDVYASGNFDSEVRDGDEVTINSATEMMYFAEYVNDAHTPTSLNYYLIADIDLSSVCGENEQNWTPIGTSVNNFVGTFYGDKYIISNLYFESADNNVVVGLFGYVSGRLNNVIVNGNVSATGSACTAGGVVGYNSGRIVNCISECDIEVGENGFGGGICGVNEHNIYSCRNIANVVGDTGSFVGGITGKILSNGFIANSYNLGNVTGIEYAGGIFGANESALTSTLSAENCYNNGIVTATNSGVICGQLNTNTTLDYCYYSSNDESVVGWQSGSFSNCNYYNEVFELLNPVTIDSVNYENIIEALDAWADYKDSFYYGNWEYKDGEIACMSCVKLYDISYLANGGLGTIDTESHIRNVEFSIKNANNFSKIGAMFTGWSTEQTGEVVYLPADTITLTSDKNLYATWYDIQDGVNGTNGVDASATLAIVSIIIATLALVSNAVLICLFLAKKSRIKK